MMISTKGRYALRVVGDLAVQPPQEYISLKDVAERQEISMKYLEAIVAMLSKAGLLESMRGKNGGYRLAKPAEEMTVGAILKVTEGSLAPVPCFDSCKTGAGCEKSHTCISLPIWRELDILIDTYLESVTVADLVNQEQASMAGAFLEQSEEKK